MKSAKRWLVSFLLYTPVLLLYISHYASALHEPARIPTGFVQYDMAYYMASAREYFDRGQLNLFYPLPFSADYHNNAIYFQPHILLLGVFWRVTGLDMGVLFILFGLAASVICLQILMALYKEAVGLENTAKKIVFLLLCWGGGVLTLAGVTYSLFIKHAPLPDALMNAFAFDPFKGWWFLNLGRNLVYPTEAYYHALFFAALYTLLKRRFATALLLTFLLSLSHPFTGISLLLILFCWSLLEQYYLRNRALPAYFCPCVFGLLLFHLAYYLVFLGRNPEHKLLMQQWALPWTVNALQFVPAYLLVAGIAFLRVRTPRLLKQFLADPFNRLCVVWAVINFVLENHEFAITPNQPVHFTRGYVWTALFLIGAPVLASGFHRLLHTSTGLLRYLPVVLVCALFLLDNIAWFGLNYYKQYTADPDALYVTGEQHEALRFLKNNYYEEYLLLSQDEHVGYLSTVYTPYRAWISHTFNTPDIDRKREVSKAFFENCDLPADFQTSNLLILTQREFPFDASCLLNKTDAFRIKQLFANRSYSIWSLTRKPAVQAAPGPPGL